MIKVTIDLWPYGQEDHKRTIGVEKLVQAVIEKHYD